MYWSIYETLLLVTGLLSAAIAILPQPGIPPRTRILSVIIGAVLLILAFVLGNVSTFTYPSIVVISPALPVLAGVMIVLDARKRVARASAVSGYASTGTAGPSAFPYAAQPQAFAAPVLTPASLPTTPAQSQAADPTTAPTTLAELAQNAPDARPFIAENPAAYPGLLEWLGQLSDPAVDAALARRAARESAPAQGSPDSPQVQQQPQPHPQASQAGYPQAVQPGQAYPGQPFAAPAARTSTVFAGLSRRELVLDSLALLLLVSALFSAAQIFGPLGIQLLGVAVTIVSLASLALGYLVRGGHIRIPATQLSAYRLYANLPFFAFAFLVLVIDVVSAFSFSLAGVGSLVLFGLAGAVLAAAPRESDQAVESPRAQKISWAGLSGLAITLVILAFLRLLTGLVSWLVNLQYGGGAYLIFAFFTLLLQLATIVPVVALLVFRRSEAARIVLLALGASGVLWALLFVLRGYAGESLAAIGVFATLLPALAALALTPAIARSTRPAQGFFGSPVSLSFVGIAVIAVFQVLLNSALLLFQTVPVGFGVSHIVFGLLTAAVAVVAALPAVRASGSARLLTLIAAGVLILLGIISLGITLGQGGAPGIFELIVTFGLPLTIILLETVKKGTLSPLSHPVVAPAGGAAASPAGEAGLFAPAAPVVPAAAPAAPTAANHGDVDAPAEAIVPEGAPAAAFETVASDPVASDPVAAQPVVPVETVAPAAPIAVAAQETVDRADILREAAAVETAAAPVEPTSVPVESAPTQGFSVAQALDPSTDAATLYSIALNAPELRVALASNPATYPDLVAWLGTLGDPAIDAALAAR